MYTALLYKNLFDLTVFFGITRQFKTQHGTRKTVGRKYLLYRRVPVVKSSLHHQTVWKHCLQSSVTITTGL